MTKSKIFLFLSVSFIGGVLCRSFFDSCALAFVLLVLAVISVSVFFKNKIAAVIAGSLVMAAAGIFLTEKKLEAAANLPFEKKEISQNLKVVKDPEQKDTYLEIIAKTKEGLKILVRADRYMDVEYGDALKADCSLEIPENWGEFDYRMYLAKDGIYYICQNAKLQKTGRREGNALYSGILKLKRKMEENVNRIIPQPEAALANGLIFGGSNRLPKEEKENFSKTGMTHIVAVSGFNVTIIAQYLMAFGIWAGLWRKKAFWLAVMGIIIFVAMIGFPSSAVRAGVMGVLLVWAAKNGRLANSWNAILFAGSIMLFLNPLLARWDIGFQLSFLATLGIVAFSPLWEKYFVKQHKAFGITEIFFLTLSAQIFVMPIILNNFQNLSLVSVPANLLVLLIIPITMLFVFLAAALGFVFYPLSLAFGWLAYLPLRYEVWIINTLAELKYASIKVSDFGWLEIFLWYFLLAGAVIFLKKKLRIGKLVWQTEK